MSTIYSVYNAVTKHEIEGSSVLDVDDTLITFCLDLFQRSDDTDTDAQKTLSGIPIGSVSGTLVLEREIELLIPEEMEEYAHDAYLNLICDENDPDLGFVVSALLENDGPLCIKNTFFGIDHFYIDEISVSDPNLLSVILAELPKMIFTHMHSFPDILSYYPMPLPHEQHQSKTQSIVEKVAKLTQAVIAEQLINGQYDTNKPHLVLTEEQRRIITGMLRRSTKANHHKGSYSYTVRQLGTENGYFFVDRHIFGRLVPRQMLIYLFLCKSFSTELNICWNSYNDIAAQTGMKRELVIQTVNELADMHLIVRMKRKARDCSRVFIDNHYQIVFFVRGRIRKREKCATVSQLRSHRLRDA